MTWSDEAIEAASLVGNGHDYIRRVLAAAVNVDGPVYRKVPSNATDPDHVCGDNECYRLVEVGEDSTP